jgi:hypothetical protein
MKKSAIILVAIGAAFLVLNETAWLRWQAGEVIVRSPSRGDGPEKTIVVKKVPMTKANAYMYFGQYQVFYKFVLLGRDGAEVPTGNNTYFAGEFNTSSGQVDWSDKEHPVIILDGRPIARLKGTEWEKVQ